MKNTTTIEDCEFSPPFNFNIMGNIACRIIDYDLLCGLHPMFCLLYLLAVAILDQVKTTLPQFERHLVS